MNTPPAERRPWTVEETRLAFYLYCLLPFGKLDQRTQEVVELARLIGRTPGALAMRLSNLASLDPSVTERGVVGLRNASRLDRQVWAEFHSDWGALAGQCEQQLDVLRRQSSIADETVADEVSPYLLDDYSGESRAAGVQRRIGQDFFRRAVLSTYDDRCCISGISEPRLLVASHIVAWAEDNRNRLNPRNGLCLSALHDRAFDRHLISLSEDLRVLVSRSLKRHDAEPLIQTAFLAKEGLPITVPRRFVPDGDLLAIHRGKFHDLDASVGS